MVERCARSREVEGLFDDRMDEPAASMLGAHVGSCVVCSRVLSSLRAMRESLRETAETPNAFVMKRLRRELLASAAAGTPPKAERPRYARFAGIFAGAFAALAALGVGVRLHAPAQDPIMVTAGPGARFSREDVGELEIVRLTDGAFEFDVHARPSGRRLLVVVPDGEIEDVGTRFRAIVQGGVTTDISVFAGEVVFKKIGAPPLRLIAGMKYQPTPGGSSSARDAEAVPSAPVRASPSLPASAASLRVDHAKQPMTGTSSAPPARSSSASADSTAEDLAYMAIVRLLRAGDEDAARANARAYLRDFPAGLRRVEVQRVAAAEPQGAGSVK